MLPTTSTNLLGVVFISAAFHCVLLVIIFTSLTPKPLLTCAYITDFNRFVTIALDFPG